MADISIRRAHGATFDEAKSKVEKIVGDVQREFPSLVDSVDWNDDRTEARVKGKAFSGQFLVDATDVAIDIDLKLFARPFKGKVQEKIEARIRDNFA